MSSSTEPNDELPSDGAPKVDNPLEVTQFKDDPCLSLTSAQSEDLDLGKSGEPDETALANTCKWRNPDTRGRVTISFIRGSSRGLSGLYRANNNGEYAYFIELPNIEGYPGVASDIVEGRENGACIVSVGVADDLSFDVALQLSTVNVGEKDPCETAEMVAGMAVRTMQEGA